MLSHKKEERVGLGCGLSIVDISIVVTLPEVIALATSPFQGRLGRLSFRMFPQFDGVATHRGATSQPFQATFIPQDRAKGKLRREPATRWFD